MRDAKNITTFSSFLRTNTSKSETPENKTQKFLLITNKHRLLFSRHSSEISCYHGHCAAIRSRKLHIAVHKNHLTILFSNHFAQQKSPNFMTPNHELSSVTGKRYTLKLLIAFRDHTVVDINLIQQLILLGDGFKHDPTSNHKVHAVSHGVEQNSNLPVKLMMTVRCPPPLPAKNKSTPLEPNV